MNQQTPPPHPPHHSEEIEQLRETVETQARTIRLLLANYEALLDKVSPETKGPVVISPTQPANALAGNLWFDGTSLWVFDGTAWQNVTAEA